MCNGRECVISYFIDVLGEDVASLLFRTLSRIIKVRKKFINA